jgi:hypothetical protein
MALLLHKTYNETKDCVKGPVQFQAQSKEKVHEKEKLIYNENSSSASDIQVNASKFAVIINSNRNCSSSNSSNVTSESTSIFKSTELNQFSMSFESDSVLSFGKQMNKAALSKQVTIQI